MRVIFCANKAKKSKTQTVDSSLKWNATSFSQANLFKECIVIEYKRDTKSEYGYVCAFVF